MRTFYGLLIILFLVPVVAFGSEVTKEAQTLLNQLGYKAGAADGIWGSKTKSAIKKFYLNQGLEFDGVLDQNELLDLENAVRIDGDLSARSLKDQPDQNADFKVHFNYVVPADAEDRKRDVTGELQNLVEQANKAFFAATQRNKYSDGTGKAFKIDYFTDVKLDVTFIRLDKTTSELNRDSTNSILADALKLRGMDNPKKIYFNFVEMEGDQGGSGGVPIAHINLQRSSVIKRPEFMLLHELVHAQGMGFKCNKGVFADHRNNHVETPDHLIGEYTAEIKLNGHIYYSGDPKCPSLIDSVYLTPTSDDPYDPYTIVCLRQLGRYNHPKTTALLVKQNYTKRYYENRFSTSCQWKKYLPNIFGN